MGFFGDIVKGATGFLGDAHKFIGGLPGEITKGVSNAVGGFVGKGVGMIFGSGAGKFVGGLIKGVGSVAGSIMQIPSKIVGGLVKGVGKVVGGVVDFIGKGVGGIIKGIGGFLGGLFGGGPSKEELRIAKQAVEDVKRKIREQYQILEEQVHAPMSKMVQIVEGGEIWIGDGADAFANDVSSINIPGAGKIQDSFDLMIERLTRAVEIVENTDDQCRNPIHTMGSSWRSVSAMLG